MYQGHSVFSSCCRDATGSGYRDFAFPMKSHAKECGLILEIRHLNGFYPNHFSLLGTKKTTEWSCLTNKCKEQILFLKEKIIFMSDRLGNYTVNQSFILVNSIYYVSTNT